MKTPALTTSTTLSTSDSSSPPALESAHGNSNLDEGTLANLGYDQELAREWSLLQNFGVSFSIISMVRSFLQLVAGASLTLPPDHRHHNTIPVWTNDRWSRRGQLWLVGRLLLHFLCRIGNGGDYGMFAERMVSEMC